MSNISGLTSLSYSGSLFSQSWGTIGSPTLNTSSGDRFIVVQKNTNTEAGISFSVTLNQLSDLSFAFAYSGDTSQSALKVTETGSNTYSISVGDTNGNTTGLANPSSVDTAHVYSHSLVNLASGFYTFQVVDDSGGSNNKHVGLDDFKTTVTAVPEPETYAMMLAGLGLISLVARKRT